MNDEQRARRTPLILPAVAAWLLIAGLMLAQCDEAGQTRGVSAVATGTPAVGVFLPAVSAGGCPCTCVPSTATPEPPPVVDATIYDCEGDITNTTWLTSTFGAVTWSAGNLAELRCSVGPSVLVAKVVDYDGRPVENATVVLWYDSAPFLPPELQQCGVDRGVYGPTNAEGLIGFGLGPDSYYFPPAGGPHLMFVAGGGSCLAGLGMIGGTEHQHLDSTWLLDGKAADADRGYSRGAVVYEQEISGRQMWVIRVP